MGSMTAEHTAAHLTNKALGELLGIDHSSASRLRRGERGASTAVMIRIEENFKWPVREQFAAFGCGDFGVQLERRVSEWTATRAANQDTPATS